MKSSKLYLMGSAMVLSLFAAASLAQAQTAGAEPALGNKTESQPGGGRTGEPIQLDDIVVTAMKQSTSLQKTPAAVSVVTSEDLVKRQVTDVRSLTTFVPSLRTNAENTATQFFLRGVGKSYDLARVPEAVALVVDGVTIPQHASGMSLFDISSIEVLPGPQGTLYGSSAIGGVININTTRPSAKRETSLLVEAGNYETAHVTAIHNMPITKDWYVRAAYNGFKHGAYNSDGTSTDNMSAFRLSSLYEPEGSNLSIYLSGMYAFDKARLTPSIPFPYLNSDPYQIPAYDPATAFFYPPFGAPNNVARVSWDVGSVTGRVDWTPGNITVSYIGGYLRRDLPRPMTNVVAGFLQSWSQKIDVVNNEVRISSSDASRFRWLGGLYQSHTRTHEELLFGPNLAGGDYFVTLKTYAAYAQGTYLVTDRTRLTGGLRVSQDSVESHGGVVFFPTGFPPNFGRGTIPVDFKKDWKRPNWKVGLEQDLGDNSMFYAAAQSGFNPGTFDGNPPNPNREVKPQTMVGYTAGLKNRFLDSRLTVNLEGFYYSYKNQIITAPDLVTGLSSLLNARRSRIYGLQVDTSFEPTENTKLYANVAYLNAQFEEFTAGSLSGPVKYDGTPMAFSPEITANIGASHTVELGEKGSIEARVDSYLSSALWLFYDHRPGLRQDSYSKTDASITYKPPGAGWQLGVWCKNIENKPIAATAGATDGRPYPGVVIVEPPRTCGGRFSISFGD